MKTQHNDYIDSSRLDVVHVLLLLQGAMALLAGGAMLLFSGGSPAVWPLTIGAPIFLFVLAAGTVRRWRWVRKATMAVQVLTLLAFAVSMLLGRLAALDFSLNLLTIITNVALPVGLIAMVRDPRLAARPAALAPEMGDQGARVAA